MSYPTIQMHVAFTLGKITNHRYRLTINIGPFINYAFLSQTEMTPLFVRLS